MNGMVKELAQLTGIDEAVLKEELGDACAQAGIDLEKATLDELRTVLARYLHQVLEATVAT